MRKRRNPEEALDTVDVDLDSDPTEMAPWYEQFLKLSEKKREEICKTALKRIQESKPETYQFIKKYGCELVGICPSISYCLLDKSQGDTDVTYIHSFSMPTLLYWCSEGQFGFFVNANLDYNDTVLNRVKGNQVDKSIKGFTS